MFKKIILSFLLLSPCTVSTLDFHHDQLMLLSINNPSEPFWCFEGTMIRQKKDGDFQQLIEKWSDVIAQLWSEFTKQLEEEVNISLEEINNFLQSSDFQQSYNRYLQKRLEESSYHLSPEENIDPTVLRFIQAQAEYLGLTDNYKTFLQNNMNLLSTSFGLDSIHHVLICNHKIYTLDNVQDFFKSIYTDHTNYFIEPAENIHKTRCIELPNLLHLGIAEAISGIIHQSHAMIYLFTNFEFNDKSISQDTIQDFFNFIQLRSFIEAVLQTKNPLEAAYFLKIQQTEDQKSTKINNLWQDFIEDIQNCYDDEDLELYESTIIQLKRRSN